MTMLKKIALKLILFTLIISCGFERVNKNSSKFEVISLNISGEKRLGYILKNEVVILSSKQSANKLNINIDIQKEKKTKEKNISNEVTKYNITLILNSEIRINERNKVVKYSKSFTADYDVGKTNSITLQNNRNKVEELTNKMIDDYINYLNIKLIL